METTMKRLMTVALLAMAAATHSQELLTVDDGKKGINALGAERNRWRPQGLEATKGGKIDPSWYRSLDNLDFFVLEYGKPCEAMDFAVPEEKNAVWSKHWGYSPESHEAGIRLGRGWENYMMCQWAVEMDIEQDAEETSWRLDEITTLGKRTDRHDFKVTGRGRQKFCKNLALIRNLVRLSQVSGLELYCQTPGAKGRIHSLRLVPRVVTITWKRTFDLDEKPVRAGLSMTGFANYLLKVNDKKVARGMGIGPTRTDRHELAGHLKKGRNEITIAAEAGGGFMPSTNFDVELFAVTRDGRTTRFEADENWLWSRDGKEWQPARRVKREINAVPLHAGALDPRPVEKNGYPVFDCDADIAWRFALPGGIKKPRLEWKVTDALKGGTVETGFCDTGLTAAGAPTVEKVVRLKTRRTGAYRVWWKLFSDGELLDEHDTEMIVAGPLEQAVVPLKDFERTLVSRMKMIQEVDCTEGVADSTRFLDHTRKWAKPQLGVGKVAETGGVRARQTGPDKQDYFAYKLDVENLGMPHILEVDYPETHEYTLYCTIAESYPIAFVNNSPPLGSKSWANATGSVKVGGYLPISGKVKTMRIVFFPGSKNITALFENGDAAGPAAVCAFRVYEVPDGLPALDIPKDAPRRYMNHNERQFFSGWGAYVNPVIRDERCGLVEDGWIAAYAAAANKTAFLRYAGHNAADEGVYMYNEGFPTRSGESFSMNPEFDFRYPLLKLYRHNGIHTVLTFEYVRSPALVRLGELSVSDREVQAGTKRTIYNVLRDGRQAVGYMGQGMNFMNSQVRASMRRLLGEIYTRYADVADVENLLIVGGSWWMPGMTKMPGYGYDEIGYNDENIEAFERETGVSLGTGLTGVERFSKRHELLNGPHRRAWYEWRAKKMKEALDELRSVVAKGGRKWEILLMSAAFGPEEETSGYRTSDFGDGTGNPVRLLARMIFERECDLESYGTMFNATSLENVWRQDCVRYTCGKLNEHWHTANAAKAWWWRETAACVYNVKPSGDCAFWNTVTTCANYAPQTIIHTWLDMNCTTAHAEACRRFVDAYYRLPLDRNPKPVESVRGMNAKRYGDKVLLVNPTPWEVEGVFGAGEKMQIGPYGMAVRDAAGAKGEFHMAAGCPHSDFAAAVKAMTFESLTKQSESLKK